MTPLAVTGQSLRIYSNIAADLTFAESVVIKYKAPGAEAVSLPATVDNAATGAVHVDIPPASLTPDGDWSVWAVATMQNGDVVKTYGARVRVIAEGAVVT